MRTEPVCAPAGRDTVPAGGRPHAAPLEQAAIRNGSGQVGTDVQATELYPAARLGQAAAAAAGAGIGALLLTPGPDLRDVTGYDAQQLERLTRLVMPAPRRGPPPFPAGPRPRPPP